MKNQSTSLRQPAEAGQSTAFPQYFLQATCGSLAASCLLMLEQAPESLQARNLIAFTQAAQGKVIALGHPDLMPCHPRIADAVLQQAQMTDGILQNLLAGLLVASCRHEAPDDSNIPHLAILSQITTVGASLLIWACSQGEKRVTPSGIVAGLSVNATMDRLRGLTGEESIERIVREVDQLRQLGLIQQGFNAPNYSVANLSPTPLATSLFVRCQGSPLSPAEYFATARVMQ